MVGKTWEDKWEYEFVFVFCWGPPSTTQATTQRAWGAPKNKRSELKSSEKTKRCFENTPPWTER